MYTDAIHARHVHNYADLVKTVALVFRKLDHQWTKKTALSISFSPFLSTGPSVWGSPLRTGQHHLLASLVNLKKDAAEATDLPPVTGIGEDKERS